MHELERERRAAVMDDGRILHFPSTQSRSKDSQLHTYTTPQCHLLLRRIECYDQAVGKVDKYENYLFGDRSINGIVIYFLAS